MTAAIVFHSVTFSFPDSDATVLEDVSLEVAEGTFVLVTGATGSGKSTLLRACNGLVPHFSGGTFSGDVRAGGLSTLQHPPREVAGTVAFIPQDPGSAFVLDRVEDELAYAMENLGIDPSAMRRRVEEVLDLLDIAPLRDRSVRSLSGGERQRVAIAGALTPQPRVLLLDEPTSQLDPQGAEDVLAALQRLVHDLGLTVLVAEHRLERVAGFADAAIGCLGRGRVVHGEPREVMTAAGTGPPVARLGELLGWTPRPLTVRDARLFARGVDLAAPPREPGGTGPPVLTARGVRAGYGDLRVLNGIDLALRAGETVALIGRNGAGKTTLLRCLAGLHEPESGRVAVLGTGSRPRPGKDVALCPQAPDTVLFCETVAEEIEATLRASGVEVDARAVLSEVGIDGLAQQHPRDLSAGQRLLVATAAVVATGARVLLLDEPTRGLDVESKAVLAAYLRRRSASGSATLFATHDVELAAAVAGRVVMLAGGEVIADGSPVDVLGDSTVFAPQTARVFGPQWLTPGDVAASIAEPAPR
ncbi:MAG: ATP-binding cassette domain-containing protein [Actinomycetota bacterium]|nr:ATP-binding cassette domain-containing protein [Actinomycetota bacterium]